MKYKHRIRKKLYKRWRDSFPAPTLNNCIEVVKKMKIKVWPTVYTWRARKTWQINLLEF